MREIQLNLYHALALGAVMYWLGAALTRKLPALRRFCVPAGTVVTGAAFPPGAERPAGTNSFAIVFSSWLRLSEN